MFVPKTFFKKMRRHLWQKNEKTIFAAPKNENGNAVRLNSHD